MWKYKSVCFVTAVGKDTMKGKDRGWVDRGG